QPKLQFSVFVPTADFFKTMRSNQAALNFQTFEQGFGGSTSGTVDSEDNGLERFLTATRRQNFLIPPRRHRAFPLIELTATVGPAAPTSSQRQATSLSGILHL
ncbi:MAG TPA: hypothetical protein VGF67_01575, partial [Ktedonobacteraceae bacterium]